MVEKLAALVGADAGLACASSEPLLYPPRPKAGCALYGWSREDEDKWLQLDAQSIDAIDPGITLGAPPPANQVTAARHQLVDDRVWYRAPYVKDILHTFKVDHNVGSLYRVRGTGHWEALALFRALGRPPFNCADVAKIRLFHEEIGRLWDQQAPCIAPLRPRLEEILRALMAGLSEKEIAANLGLSQHTVHDYIKTLHKTYRVRSRGELLAAASGRLSVG
jgi:DNA-binding CsgD family transcriptional regulator